MDTIEFYLLCSHVSRLAALVAERQRGVLGVFPVNTTSKDAREYELRFAKVNQLHRVIFLAGIIPRYWNASRGCPGPEFNFKIWKEMMNYGFKHPVRPPTHH